MKIIIQHGAIGVTLLIVICSLMTTQSLAQVLLSSSELLSSNRMAYTEGQIPNAKPTYLRLDGTQGMELELAMPQTRLFDYTVMFWFRSAKSLSELASDDSILNQKAYLFEMPGSVACFVTRTQTEDPWLQCSSTIDQTSSDDDMKINLADLPDIQAWMHLTYSANHVPTNRLSDSKLTAYLNIEEITVTGAYVQMQDRNVYYGIGMNFEKDGNGKGFAGDYRQFYFTLGYVEEASIDLLKHQEKTLEFQTRGYYKFGDSDFTADVFRQQRARLIGTPSQSYEEDIVSPYCQSLPQKLVKVPKFEKSPGFSKIKIEDFKDEQDKFGYTVSIWLRNSGTQNFSSDPKKGRTDNHIFEIVDAFAIWFDSPTSLKVYVYAVKDYHEISTQESIVVPLHEWVNVQVTISAESGVTAMTFNQNGDRIQLIHMKQRLAKQYPRNEMSLMQSFSGVPYTVQAWQKFIPLPIDQDSKSLKTDMIADYNFLKNNYSGGWKAKGGRGSTLKASGKDFDWIQDKVPSNVDYTSPSLLGQLEAKSTEWNGVSCPDPETSQIYFNGEGAGFSMNVEVKQTELYTVEFWFRPNVNEAQKLKAQDDTILFTMEDAQFSAMTIYVDAKGKLKCAPFGRGTDGAIIEYQGVDVFNTDKWQHISCIFSNEKYVKGQYLAVNLDPSRKPVQNFEQTVLTPRSFVKSIAKITKDSLPNVQKDNEWTIVIGNEKDFSKKIFGTFKDIRLWKSERSDGKLYQHRFQQVRSTQEEDLQASFKLMDGNENVINAVQTFQSVTVVPNSMTLKKADGQNLICAADTFFDPKNQACWRNPYQQKVQLTYMNLESDGKYQMKLESLTDSAMILPGAAFQPDKALRWSVNDPQLGGQALSGTDQSSYAFDLDSVTAGRVLDFEYVMSDAKNHDFFVTKEQRVIPVKCHVIVDTTTDESFGFANQIISSTNSVTPLCVEFQAKMVSKNCDIESVSQNLAIRSQPDLGDRIHNRFYYTFDKNSNKFLMCIPESAINDTNMPRNTPINLIFTLFFDTDSIATIDIVYKVTFASEIIPSIEFHRNVLNRESEDDLVIDARKSRFSTFGNQNEDGLTFRWECAKDFQTYCDGWAGSPILQIPNDKVQLQQLNKFYTFTVVVSSIGSGHDSSAENGLSFRMGDQFIWTNLSTPKFQIVKPDYIHVTKDELITINPTNFRFSDSGYRYEFRITPEVAIKNPYKVQVSSGGNVLTIQQGALNFLTTYKIDVKVYKDGLVAPGEEVYYFTTGKEPKIAENGFKVSPVAGNMFETDFTVTLSEYEIEDPSYEFMLFGEKRDSENTLFRLTPTYQKLNNDGSTFVTTKLPDVIGIIARIQDANKEIVEIKTGVNSEKPNNFNDSWFDYLQSKTNSLSGDPVQLWQFYSLITLMANSEAFAGVIAKEVAIKVNTFVVDSALEKLNDIPEDSIDPADMVVIREIVTTFQQISDYEMYLQENTFETMIDVIYGLINRSQAEVLFNDPVFNSDFVKLLGNMFLIQADRADVSQRRLMQGSSVAALDGIEKSFRQILCKQKAITNGATYTQINANLEIQILKVNKESTLKDVQFVNSNGEVQIDIPLDQILTQTSEASADYEWICIMASFQKGNRVASSDTQKFQKDAYTMYMTTLDSEGHYLLAKDSGGFSNADTSSFKLTYKFNFNSDFYRNGQTECMHADPGSNEIWSSEGCTTIKNQKKPSNIECSCQKLHDYYYAVITDTTKRIIDGPDGKPVILAPKTPKITSLAEIERRDQVLYILLFIVIPLGMLGCLVPCYLVHLDYTDFLDLNNQIHQVDPLVIDKFEIARKKASKHEIFFNEIEIKKYMNYTDLGCCKGFLTFNRTLHPLVSLFSYYDFKLSRMARFTFVLGQVSLITVLTWICFSKTGTEVFNNSIEDRFIIVSLILSLVTLPLPRRFIKCLEKQIYVLKDDTDGSSEQMVNETQTAKVSPPTGHQPQDIDFEFDHGGETTTEMGDGDRATLMEPWVNLKIFFLIVIYLFWAFSMSLSVAFMFFTHETGESEGFRSYLELTADEAWLVVVAWYLATFGWGWLVFNELRILLISLLAPSQAQAIFDRSQCDQSAQTPKFQSLEEPLSCVTCALIPPQSVEISLDALFIIDIKKNPSKYGPENDITKIKHHESPKNDEKSQYLELGRMGGTATKPRQEQDSKRFTVGDQKKGTSTSTKKDQRFRLGQNQAADNENVDESARGQDSMSLSAKKQAILLQGESVPLPAQRRK